MCLSEGPYLLFTAVSLMCLLKGTSGVRVSAGWIIVAGVTGGLSWCLRNVAVALFASSLGYLLMQLLRRRSREVAVAICSWLGGWTLASGWLVVWNILTFGSPTPYNMPPSELSFLWNCKVAFWVVGWDLVPLCCLSAVLVNKYMVIALGIAILLAMRPSWRRLIWFVRDARDGLLLLLFACFYTLTIVVARSVYRWGEDINSRHFVPIYWVLLLLLVVGGKRIATHFLRRERTSQTVLVIGIGLLACLQTRISVMQLMGPSNETEMRVRQVAIAIGRVIPDGKLVLTDAIASLRVFGDVNARLPPRASPGRLQLTWTEIKQAGEDGRLWGVVIEHEDIFAQGEFGDVLKDIIGNPGDLPRTTWPGTWDGGAGI